MSIREAHAMYTGGGIWLFYGRFANGNYFIMDDYGCIGIFDSDPSFDWDESLMTRWQTPHLVGEPQDRELTRLQHDILDIVTASGSGGFTDEDREIQLKWFAAD